jgi:DNA-binding NtrC family response regulator
VLIADDDDLCSEILRDAMEPLGVEVAVAGDGIEALELLEAHPFDILITDLYMPRMDGLTLLTHARKLVPHLLTVIITGFGSLESAIEAIRQGAYDYVQKPFKLEEISIVIRNAMEKINFLREKARLIRELEQAHQELSELRTMAAVPREEAVCPEPAAPSDAMVVFPRHTLPISFFQPPEDDSSRLLSELERLKRLREERAVSQEEFDRLKKSLLDRGTPIKR